MPNAANLQTMNGMTKAILEGNRLAIKLARTCITTPTLINVDATQGAKYAIPLLCETNQKSASAEVSENLVITTDKKQNVTDNIAPGSKSWHLSGYLHVDGEVSNYFMPLLQFYEDVLWQWRDRGAILMYKDGNAKIYDRVVIKDLQTSQQKDSANAIPFTMTLKEINVIPLEPANVDGNGTPEQEKASKPDTGSADGPEQNLGSEQPAEQMQK